jgi:hypothetical protein
MLQAYISELVQFVYRCVKVTTQVFEFDGLISLLEAIIERALLRNYKVYKEAG